MYEDNIQSVLRCELCNKPFNKESTLKRHGYYCRSRKAISTPSRSRSCISCAKRKGRCDKRRPQCSTCKTKTIECHYPENRAKDITRTSLGPGDDVRSKERELTPSLEHSPSARPRRRASEENYTTDDSALVASNPEFSYIGEDFVDWIDQDVDLAGFLSPQTNASDRQYLASVSDISILTPSNTGRSFLQRPKQNNGMQRITNLIRHTLKSYPLMMLRPSNVPPYIHPLLISSEVENSHMEPLNNCIGLLHMISSVPGSRKLFWKNVRLECERLHEECVRFDKWQLLTAMQAILIYILTSLDEVESDYNNLDFLLTTTVIVLAKQLADARVTSTVQSTPYNYDLKTRWKEWIFEESERRLCIAYQIVNMLVYFEPAAMCDLPLRLVLAPLPAKKQLWEASDEVLWKEESKRELEPKTSFGLASDGELVKVDQDWIHCRYESLLHEPVEMSRTVAKWEEWCSGMDEFGGLVMLAASLIE